MIAGHLRTSRLRPAVLGFVAALVLLGLSSSYEGARTVDAAPLIALTPVTTGLSSPNNITHAGDGRLFINEQPGRVRIYDSTQTPALRPTPFLDISALVSCCDERGLLGLAFHPQYASNGFLYVDYTRPDGDIVVARYHVSANPNVADAASAKIILTIEHSANTNHNGGQLAFGPDGYLYIAVGDGGGGGDTPNNAQNLNVLLGKLLRIDVNVDPAPYAIPPSNPYAGGVAADDPIWAYGLRNPWRFSFDRSTGELFIGDVGQGAREEIDYQAAGAAGGANYGWRLMEGTLCYNPPSNCNPGGLTAPILEYAHGTGDCAVTAGYRYRGTTAAVAGMYLYGDYCSGKIWGATKTGNLWSTAELLNSSLLISSFGEDNAGELYVAHHGAGEVYRIVFQDTDSDGLADAADNCPSNANPAQENSDGNFIDQTPPKALDDATWVQSDAVGDACDTDDDNDGRTDASEIAGTSCAPFSAPTNSLARDSDGDRYLDGAECARGTNPNDVASVPALTSCGAAGDADADGLRDQAEVCFYNSNPNNVNSDGDTCGDGREAANVDSNFTVGASDLGLIASGFGTYPVPYSGGNEWRWNMDLDKNGTIGASDLGLAASRFGACP